MKNFIKVMFIILPLFSLNSQNIDTYVRLTPDKYYVDFAKLEDPVSPEKFYEAGLYASGVRLKDTSRYINIFNGMLEELRIKNIDKLSDYDKGEAILAYLHRHLSSYAPLQTKLDVLHDEGTFNCVSSAVLYMSLSRSFGLDIYGVGTNEHAFSIIRTGNDYINVETTNLYGFDPGTKKEFINSFTNETGFVYVPRKNYRNTKRLSDKKFISLILQNRLYVLQDKRKTEAQLKETVSLATDLAALSSDYTDIRNRSESVIGLAILLDREGNTDKALKLLDRQEELYGVESHVRQVKEDIASNKIINAIKNDDLKQAKDYFIKYKNDSYLNTKARLEELESSINSRNIFNLINSGASFETKLQELNQNSASIGKKQLNNLYISLYSSQMNLLQKEGKFADIFNMLKTYPKDMSNDTRVKRMLSVAEKNLEIAKHNEFVTHFNNRDYSRAEKFLTETFKILPNSSILKKDRKMLDQVYKK